jgi:hypothetical protein
MASGLFISGLRPVQSLDATHRGALHSLNIRGKLAGLNSATQEQARKLINETFSLLSRIILFNTL